MVNRTANSYCRLALGLGLLTIASSGCATTGASPWSTMRPGYGGAPAVQPGTVMPQRSFFGPVIRPGTGLQPTPTMSTPPAINGGPALPDSARRLYPESTATSRPPRHPNLPTITPQRDPGAPIATNHKTPATLSGDIEIIPGPSIRSRRARFESLPAPPEGDGSSVEILPQPTAPRYEELPPPA